MQEWSIGVVVVVVLVVAVALRLPWRRARSLRVESRIGTAAVEFAPPSRLKTPSPHLVASGAAALARGGPKHNPTRAAASRARRAAPRRKPKRCTR